MIGKIPSDADIANALVDEILAAQREYDKELFCGFGHTRRDKLYLELQHARETLINFINKVRIE